MDVVEMLTKVQVSGSLEEVCSCKDLLYLNYV